MTPDRELLADLDADLLPPARAAAVRASAGAAELAVLDALAATRRDIAALDDPPVPAALADRWAATSAAERHPADGGSGAQGPAASTTPDRTRSVPGLGTGADRPGPTSGGPGAERTGSVAGSGAGAAQAAPDPGSGAEGVPTSPNPGSTAGADRTGAVLDGVTRAGRTWPAPGGSTGTDRTGPAPGSRSGADPSGPAAGSDTGTGRTGQVPGGGARTDRSGRAAAGGAGTGHVEGRRPGERGSARRLPGRRVSARPPARPGERPPHRRAPVRLLVMVGVAVLVGAAVLLTRPVEPARLDLATAARSALGVGDAGPLADPARRAACLAAVGVPGVDPAAPLLAGRPVETRGRAGVLLVLPGDRLGVLRVVVVDPECGPGGGELLDTALVGG